MLVDHWDDLGPPVADGAAGVLGSEVALRLRRGERWVDVLGSDELRAELDEHPNPLAAVARDADVRAALAAPG